eukprot:TRINITY_DN6155_c0_g1_i1.p1 TRINITY_DN6155_c0_g1~~TRINITY_DN6155_c0_g1_i1.p1  ORF type:complete len:281 (+),score=49.34 TRINITY_DN6155_c0_g1_i1:56-844(+)
METLRKMLADFSAGNGPRRDGSTDYLIVLNNIEVSAEYILKLKGGMDAELQLFAADQSATEKVRSCLADLTQTSKKYKVFLEQQLEQVAKTVTPSIRPLIEMFIRVNYNLTEAAYAEYEINDPFVHRFGAGFDALYTPFKSHLTKSNGELLVHILMKDIVHRLEKAVFQKSFNQLGALQFDKDLRSLSGYFSQHTNKTVRGIFARLNQMSSLLSLERVDEVNDYWGENSGQMTWRLTPGEVRKVLSRRIEFSAQQIASLKLG